MPSLKGVTLRQIPPSSEMNKRNEGTLFVKDCRKNKRSSPRPGMKESK